MPHDDHLRHRRQQPAGCARPIPLPRAATVAACAVAAITLLGPAPTAHADERAPAAAAVSDADAYSATVSATLAAASKAGGLTYSGGGLRVAFTGALNQVSGTWSGANTVTSGTGTFLKTTPGTYPWAVAQTVTPPGRATPTWIRTRHTLGTTRTIATTFLGANLSSITKTGPSTYLSGGATYTVTGGLITAITTAAGTRLTALFAPVPPVSVTGAVVDAAATQAIAIPASSTDVNIAAAPLAARIAAQVSAHAAAGLARAVGAAATTVRPDAGTWTVRAAATGTSATIVYRRTNGPGIWAWSLSASAFRNRNFAGARLDYQLGTAIVPTSAATRRSANQGMAPVAGIPVARVNPAGDNAAAIYAWLRHTGASRAGATGMLANLEFESGFNPGAVESSGPILTGRREGIGLAQWSFSRRLALQRAALTANVAWQNLDFQLRYLTEELTNPYYRDSLTALRDSTDPVRAAVILHRNFEGSTATDASIRATRGVAAARWYATFTS